MRRPEFVVLAAALATGGCNLLVGIEPWGATAASSTSSTGVGGESSATASQSTSTTSSIDASSGVGGANSTPRCDDHVLNGDESDIDCGGDACHPCEQDAHCKSDADCATLTCQATFCVAFVDPGCHPDPRFPTCADCTQNGTETAVDCGGDACPPCGAGVACLVDSDCESGACVAALCGAPQTGCAPVDPDNPSCANCQRDGGETAVDCGGDACPPCADGLACLTDADCASALCVAAVCTPAQ
ncbi:MAG: hypothetical protein U0414_26825 [Polyangiaceae bacterium]